MDCRPLRDLCVKAFLLTPLPQRPLLDALFERIAVDDALHEDTRRVDLVGLDLAGRDEVLDLNHRHLGRSRHHGVEVARGLAEDEVALAIGLPRVDHREVGEEATFHDIGGAVELARLLSLAADGKETREFDGATYVMERGLFADLAVIHAWKADREGNLVFRKTARNFNPVMATAAKVTVVEVEHLVAPGEIEPDQIHTPGVFVQRIVHGDSFEKRIEQRTLRKRG